MNGNMFLRWLRQLKAIPLGRGSWHGASGAASARRCRRARQLTFRPRIEGLEERVVPSAAAPFTPAQIRAAYGIDQVKFGSTEIVGNGAGQTIVIMEIGIDDSLTTDLQYFDQKLFGTGPDGAGLLDTFGSYSGPVAGSTKPWFEIVHDQYAPPLTDAQYLAMNFPLQKISQHDVEADLDSEWSHAIAPMANILVVQTASVQAGTAYAGYLQMSQPQLGISVITSSSDQFSPWEPADYADPNVAYVNITDDTGTPINSNQFGFTSDNYPGSSPLVIAVGGTTLTLNADGSYGSETGWGFAGPNRFLTADTATYSPAAQWTATPGGFSGTTETDDAYDTVGTATWTTTVSASDILGRNDGGLEISATWTPAADNADNATYYVYDDDASPIVSVDQSVAPNGTIGTSGSSSATFQELCTLSNVYVGETITVVLRYSSPQTDGQVVADAIGIGPDDASGGGFSTEPQPSYQNNLVIHDGVSIISSNGVRANPDVAFDGDYVNSPVAYYNEGSYLLGESASPIRHGAGTSLGAPCWAGLIAIADQGLATSGQAPMGTAEALAGLYDLPSYDFHDETSGYNGYSAGPGYDLVTGLGSPIANQLIPDLDNEVLYLDNPVLDMTNSEPQVSGPLVYEAPEGQGPNHIAVFRFGPTVGIDDNGQIVAMKLLADTTAFDILGANNTSNTLSIDFDPKITGVGILPDLAYPAGVPVTFDGGALGGGSGTLILTDGTFTTEIDSASGPHSGTLTLDSTSITYTNLAPIIDTTTALTLTIEDPEPGDHVTIQNDPNSPEGGIPTSEIEGSGFEKIDFANMTNVIFFDTSGAGTDTFDQSAPLVNNATLTIKVSPEITDGPPSTPVILGKSYSFQYTASGSPAPSFTLLPGSTLPTGLTLSPAGLLSGTDTNAAEAGRTFTGIVDAGNGADATQYYSIIVLGGATIAASPGATVVLGTGVDLTASARLAGGYLETGTITFKLYAPNNAIVDTETVSVNGTGTYHAPRGYMPSVRGTYQWAASYSGDAINNSVSTNKGAAPEVVAGPGVTVVGRSLYLVGGNTNDRLAIAPVGASQNGSTGIKVSGVLDNISFNNLIYTQAFATIYVVGFGGNDIIQFATTLNIATAVSAGDGNDRLQLGNGTNEVDLGNGNDSVTAGDGNNSIRAGGGTDTVTVGAAGSAGTIYVLLGNGNHDSVSLRGKGNDRVQVGDGNNDSVSVNGDGNDQIVVGNGTNDSVSLVGNGNEVIQTGTGTGKLHIVGTGTRNLRLGKGWNQL